MPNQYYYLAASLPRLVFGEPSPIRDDELLAECAKWLAGRDQGVLQAVSIQPDLQTKGLPAVAREWQGFNDTFRRHLAAIRRERKTNTQVTMPADLKTVFDQGTPLEKEREIMRIAWDFLTELETDHHFDLAIVLIYRLKLLLLERLAGFDAEAGQKVFEKACEATYA